MLSVTDWAVLLGYLAWTFGIAWHVRLRQNTTSDFFMAGRSASAGVAAISLFATLFSTISFVAVPGEAYQHGVLQSLTTVGYALFVPVAMALFLKVFYNQGESFSVYEYLERRFDVKVRTLGAGVFLLSRAVYGAVAFYSGGVIVESLIGWSPSTTILAIGSFTIVYTITGGMRGVMLADVLQTIVILIGVASIWYALSGLIDHDYVGMWSYAVSHDHGFNRLFEPAFYRFNIHDRFSFWLLLGVYSIMWPLQDYGTDQLIVQRLLSAKSYAAAKRAVWIKTLMVVPILSVFWLIGLMMYYYFNAIAGSPPASAPDKLLGFFVVNYLPRPLPGLITAALLAALMSTVSGVFGSLSTVTCIDILKRQGLLTHSERSSLLVGKLITAAWGVATIAIALGIDLAGRDLQTSVFEISRIIATVWGVLLVIMFAGVLTTWATARAAFWGLLIGLAINMVLPYKLYYGTLPEERVSFGWLGIPGVAVTGLIVVVLSGFDRCRIRNAHAEPIL